MFTVEDVSGRLRTAPSWFDDWVELGYRAALGKLTSQTARQVVFAVSVPVRTMPCAAIAVGFCCARYLKDPSERCPPGSAFELDESVRGARIWMRLADRVLAGKFFGIHSGDQVRTSVGTYQARVVQEVRRLPDWANVSDCVWRDTGSNADLFLQTMLGGHDPLSFVTSWNWDIVLVGSRASLSEDLRERISRTSSSGPMGALAEIVRPLDLKSTETRPAAPGWRSVLMSAHSEKPVWVGWPHAPQVVVLDGASTVTRWLDDCDADLVIAILDRTEQGLDEAVSVLAQKRAYARRFAPSDILWSPPKGCELMAFGSRA